MTSSGLELSILKLTSPRKRLGHSARFSYENDVVHSLGPSNCSSPMVKGTGSLAWYAEDDLFTIFEQHRAAVPFKWEASPGTRRDDAIKREVSNGFKDGMSDSDQENSSASSPTFTLSPSSSTNGTSRTSSTRSEVSLLEEPQVVVQAFPEFPIKSIQLRPPTNPRKQNGAVQASNDVDNLSIEPVSKSQPLALRPPPGMQSIKQLLSLEGGERGINTSCFSARTVNCLINSSSSCNSSSITNLKALQRRSFRKDGLKALPFLSSPKKPSEDFLAKTTMLGFEEWSKVVEQQEKAEKQLQGKEEKQRRQGTPETKGPPIKGSHHRTLSMPRLAIPSFMKKSATDKESGGDFLGVDSVFDEDFGKKGGLRDRRPLSSMSSRTLADGYTPKTRSWVFDNDVDYSDTEEYFDPSQVIAEEHEERTIDEKERHNDVKEAVSGYVPEEEAPAEKRKRDALSRLKRMFRSMSHVDQLRVPLQKPSRLSSVAPAPSTPVARAQSEPNVKKASQHSKQVTKTVTSPIIKMCMSNPIGQALLKNVRQLRSFEFHNTRPRALTSK